MASLRFDRFELDEAEARLTCAGQPVALAPKPFAVLCELVPKAFIASYNGWIFIAGGERVFQQNRPKADVRNVLPCEALDGTAA